MQERTLENSDLPEAREAVQGSEETHLHRLERELLATVRELRELGAEAASLRERLRREVGEREEFLAQLGHELRTPLTVIEGYLRLLAEEDVGSLNAEQARFLGETRRACRRLRDFVDRALAVARTAGADDVLELENADLAPVLHEVASLFAPLLQEGRLRTSIACAPGAARARFDRARLICVLSNLFENALRYAPPGSVLELAARPAGGLGEGVEVSVGDAGPGVPGEDRKRIFLPHVRAAGGGDHGGLGIGLAVCRRIVEAHGGRIWVEPREPCGSRFAFTLPSPESGTGAGSP